MVGNSAMSRKNTFLFGRTLSEQIIAPLEQLKINYKAEILVYTAGGIRYTH